MSLRGLCVISIRSDESPILILVGPTASGKSALAIEVARRIGGEIVSADAMQIYRECDIVTAKPTPLERQAAPHHLLDICAPDEQFSAVQWAQQARAAIAEIESRGRRAIVCGGTGFYVRALLEPERLSAPAPDEDVRAEIEAQLQREGVAILMAELQILAPLVAAKLEPNDSYRVVRALQIARQRARGDAATPPASPVASPAEVPRDAPIFALSWPREQLYRRINMRVDAMLAAGAPDETRALLDRWGAYTPWASGVGYAQLIHVLEDQFPLDDAVRDWKQASRRYAKRQQTWFRNQTAATWLDATRDVGELADEVIERPNDDSECLAEIKT